ncbi:MAG: FHA domain-containing protein [Deltaproteobacteria bacterium]|nr:FHA domain-containing protein [Deltaproteobacteria bacterium]
MEKSELLSAFESRVGLFEKYQGYIERAQSQSSRFAKAVVEKVVQDNEQKSLEVVLELIPLTADMDEVVQQLSSERAALQGTVQEAQFQLEELELRKEIGDLSEEDFETEAGQYRTAVSSVDVQVADIETELGRFQGVISRWQELGTKAGVLQSESADSRADGNQPEAQPDHAGGGQREDLEIEDFGVEDVDADLLSDPGLRPGSDSMEPIEAEDDSEQEGGDVPQPSERGRGAQASVAISPKAAVSISEEREEGFEVGDLDILGDDDEVELGAGDQAVPPEEKSDRPRRAVLLYQEGTPEEQIYPFSADVLSIGRGRDNDVQVKNDSKVSRYHCKLYRRGPNFYIEDNKSANGTLVNGELITERRLFGGEEVIIGETFFRFRILD